MWQDFKPNFGQHAAFGFWSTPGLWSTHRVPWISAKWLNRKDHTFFVYCIRETNKNLSIIFALPFQVLFLSNSRLSWEICWDSMNCFDRSWLCRIKLSTLEYLICSTSHHHMTSRTKWDLGNIVQLLFYFDHKFSLWWEQIKNYE